MSLWSEYYKEIWDRETLEKDFGFIQWHFEGEACFIDELFIAPAHRLSGKAKELADGVTLIARSRGSKRLVCAVWPENRVSSVSMQTVLAYGFKLVACDGRRIILAKELEEVLT